MKKLSLLLYLLAMVFLVACGDSGSSVSVDDEHQLPSSFSTSVTSNPATDTESVFVHDSDGFVDLEKSQLADTSLDLTLRCNELLDGFDVVANGCSAAQELLDTSLADYGEAMRCYKSRLLNSCGPYRDHSEITEYVAACEYALHTTDALLAHRCSDSVGVVATEKYPESNPQHDGMRLRYKCFLLKEAGCYDGRADGAEWVVNKDPDW